MKEIRLTKGKMTIVDDEDYDMLMDRKWYCSSGGYACNKRNDGIVYMHRKIMGCPENMVVDHINGNRLDNRKENLRVIKQRDNLRNQKPGLRGKYSSFKGVSYLPKRSKWRAYITVDSKMMHIGLFESEEEAGLAYNKKAMELFGEFAWLNEI